MPRVSKKAQTNDLIENVEKDTKKKKTTAKSSTKSVKEPKEKVAKTTAKKSTEKKTTKVAKKEPAKKTTKTTTKKTSSSETKTKKTTATKTTTTRKRATKKTVNPVKSSLLSRSRKAKKEDTNSDMVAEYYDLPYRYNQTVVKILAQTPSILFVYWDISDEDRANFVSQYGDDFFSKTQPILLIHNKTRNYTFEVEINDFANSWYLRMQEPDCEYEIELGRRNKENRQEYIYVTSSNKLILPNDHVLFEKTDFSNIRFKNIKTGAITRKDYGSIRLLNNIEDIYNKEHKILEFYKKFYNDEIFNSRKMFSNPSSGNPTSGMF